MEPGIDIVVHHDIELSGEQFRLLVKTLHSGGEILTTAVHRCKLGQHIGGMRFICHSGDDAGRLSELAVLSKAMTDKCAASQIPAQGQKSLGWTANRMPDEASLARLVVEHARVVVANAEYPIFGLDIGIVESCMDRVVELAPDLAEHVSGVTRKHGGLEVDEAGFTAFGAKFALGYVADHMHLQGRRVTIQGGGAVGGHLAVRLGRADFLIMAINNQHGCLCSTDPEGLDVEWLVKHRRELKDGSLAAYPAEHPGRARFTSDPDEIFSVPTDIFVPAARTKVLARADELTELRIENPAVRDVEEFRRQTGVRCVLEAANGPLSAAAESKLEEAGVFILPDFIANCGGLIASFAEWAWQDLVASSQVQRENLRLAVENYITHVLQRNLGDLLRIRGGARQVAEQYIVPNRMIQLEDLLQDMPPSRDRRAQARTVLEEFGFALPG